MTKKLIRDYIPDILDQKKIKYKISILDDAAYNQALERKLLEETTEFIEVDNSKDIAAKKEELADVLEVVEAIFVAYDFSKAEIETIRQEKRRTNGAFEKRLFLEELEQKDDK